MQVCHYSNVLSLALDRPSASGGAGLAELLGDTLLTKEGEVPLKMALGGKKHVMLYSQRTGARRASSTRPS